METIEIYLPDPASTRALGVLIGRSVKQRLLACLTGPLGAGKTSLVQGIGEGLGVSEIICSPTFTMLNEYHSGRLPLYHMDLYRVNDEPGAAKTLDLLQAEMDEFLHAPGVVLIEWAESLRDKLPADQISIELAYTQPDAGRTARIKNATPEIAAALSDMVLAHR
jgi:tRNA threonylcarbamoyladenosine biosynthesis protein TsaE